MPGKMAGSDPRPSVRITRGAGSGQYLASVLQEGRENTNIMPVWDSSGESRLMARRHSIKLAAALDDAATRLSQPETDPLGITELFLILAGRHWMSSEHD
jgi:hypothetical protein